MRSQGIKHTLRALASAAAVVVLSLTFHVLGGGHAPDLPSLAVLTALVATVTAPLTRRTVRLPGLLLVLAAAQVALHAAFEAHSAAAGAHGGGSPVLMAVMHAGAALLTALLVSRGGAALRRAWAWCTVRHLVLSARRPVGQHPRLSVPVHRRLPAPSPGTDAVMGRAPPALVRHAT